MSKYRKKFGNKGEEIAAWYLKRNGYDILERGFATKRGEIDIIAYNSENVLCFIEVKTRRTLEYGMPYESVTSHKIRTIKGMANYYMFYKLGREVLSRIEVVSIIFDGDKVRISKFRYE